MRKLNLKKAVISAIILCLIFLFGIVIVKSMPRFKAKRDVEQSVTEQEEKNESSAEETKFEGVSTYKNIKYNNRIRGEAYGSCGMYYQNEDGCLYYMDAASGKEVIACNKKDCTHKVSAGKTTGCEADFNHVSAYVPSGKKLYYIPSEPLKRNVPWEIWNQDLTGGNKNRVVSIWEKQNTKMTIQGMQCDGLHLIVAFRELGHYNKRGKYTKYPPFRQKGGIYMIKLEDWSYERVYFTRDYEDNVLGKQAYVTISDLSLGTQEVRGYCSYYDTEFDPKKYFKMPDKKRNQYKDEHRHNMRKDISFSDLDDSYMSSYDGCHSFVFSGDWCFDQDYYGNLVAENIRSGDYIVLYSSPKAEKKIEYDSGYVGITAGNNSIFYYVWDKGRKKKNWYRYDIKKGRSQYIGSTGRKYILRYSSAAYIYMDIFRKGGHVGHRAIPISDLEQGIYQFMKDY